MGKENTATITFILLLKEIIPVTNEGPGSTKRLPISPQILIHQSQSVISN